MRGKQEDQQGTCIASTPENDLRDRRGRLGGLIGGLLGALPYVALAPVSYTHLTLPTIYSV